MIASTTDSRRPVAWREVGIEAAAEGSPANENAALSGYARTARVSPVVFPRDARAVRA
jgi:hypothetical protein